MRRPPPPRHLVERWGRDAGAGSVTWQEFEIQATIAASPFAQIRSTRLGQGDSTVASERTERVRDLYQAFNERDLDAVTAAMTSDVDWPNGWEGGRLVGRDAVRDYWERQWAHIRPTTTVRSIGERPDGTVEAKVRLTVRDPAGTVLSRTDVMHVYAFDGALVQRMTVQ